MQLALAKAHKQAEELLLAPDRGHDCPQGQELLLAETRLERLQKEVATSQRAPSPTLAVRGDEADDARRLEVVVNGFPLHGCAQLAVDTTHAGCVLHGGGKPRRGV